LDRCTACGHSLTPGDWSGDTAADLSDTAPGLPPPAATAAGRPSATRVRTSASGQAERGPLEPGQPFGPRYHIIRVLGMGGMGAVYHAWDEELGVAVALKIVRPGAAVDSTMAAELERRFKRELLLARQVTHKNVVRIHDLGEIEGIKYITMPYVDGVELASLMREESQLPVERTLEIARAVVSGLVAAHAAGVVHRDLKPANIMIAKRGGDVLIMDFGIARSAGGPADRGLSGGGLSTSAGTDGATVAGTVVGTVQYMAPEQARGQEVDQRADLYALGLILYDMLAGPRRFEGHQGPVDELRKRMEAAPPPIKTLRPDVPAPFAQLIGRLVEPRPDARPATTADLAAELDTLDAKGNLKPLPKRLTHRFVAGAAALTAAAIVATWQFALSRIPPEPPPPMSVLVADVDNRTGDPVFDGSVEQALTTAIEGASFITAYPHADAQRLAAQLDRERIDEATARLISRREGIKVILAGSVARAASGYEVAIRAIDPAVEEAGAAVLADVSARASDKNQVPLTVAQLAARLRSTLGDTTPESARLSESETFTAGSLEALQAYTRAQSLADANRNDEALTAYQRTIELDPNFGRAYAGMGVIYTIFKDEAKAKAAYDDALRLVDRMSEREKYRTLGTYYMSVARNYEKAIENYEMLVQRFPADDGGHANLGLAYLYTGNVTRAIEEARQVLAVYPSQWAQRYNYAMYSMYAGDFETASAEGLRVIEEASSFSLAFLPVALSALATGDFDRALQVYGQLEASGESGAVLARFGRADLELYRGRSRQALALLEQGMAIDEADANTGMLAQDLVAAAEAHLALGQTRPALEAARRAITLSSHESVLFPAAMVFVNARQFDEAGRIVPTLENMLQTHTTAYARLIAAEIATRRGHYGEAIELFRDSIRRRDTWFARFLLGRLYAETDHFPEAIAELEICLKRRGEVTDVFFYDTPTLRYLPPLYYWHARAQQALGVAGAPESYRRFVDLRAAADPPDPLVADAEKRLGAGRTR
jgi:serine/threonine protein kinase/Flp pilus assembly protein TadD